MRNNPENISNLDWNLLCQKYDNLEEVIAKVDEDYPIAYLIGDVSFYEIGNWIAFIYFSNNFF